MLKELEKDSVVIKEARIDVLYDLSYLINKAFSGREYCGERAVVVSL